MKNAQTLKPPKAPKLSFKEMVERAGFSWRKLKIEKDGGSILGYNVAAYPITPIAFLQIAKEDLQTGGLRGLVNSLTNAKRAIDCQTDTFIRAMGYSPNKLRQELGKDSIDSLRIFSTNDRQPLTFRVLESLGVVTPDIVNKVRRIRNLLEHQYRKPAKSAVKDAIDIAALYISALEGSMNSVLETVYFYCNKVPHPNPAWPRESMYEKSLWIDLNPDGSKIEFEFRDWVTQQSSTMNFTIGQPLYLAFLRVLFCARTSQGLEEAIGYAFTMAGYNLGSKSIKIISIGR